jgi:two-component sensor histidine kinase
MARPSFRLTFGPLTSIRARLGAALALALLPVLLLGAVQAMLTFSKDADQRRLDLALAAQRSASTARARMDGAAVLLETVAPEAVGVQCAQRLSEIAARIPGYINLIRFDAEGRVTCAAASVPANPARRSAKWFQQIAAGASQLVIKAPPDLATRPALMAVQPLTDTQGRFDGVVAAVIDLAALRPTLSDPSLPQDTEVALANGRGHFLFSTRPDAFVEPPSTFPARATQRSMIYYGRDLHGQARVYSAAPLSGDLYVVLSTPREGLLSWAWLNPLSSLLFPLLAFTIALAAVWVVADRIVVFWLRYLQRIAAIYAKGRLTVRPVQADHAPPEIRELAQTLEAMATAITARDDELLNSISEKDALMREIHHRVKNNLQVITSLVNMQQRSMSDPAARAAMTDMRHRIGALALIYRALYQGPDLKRVDLRQFLSDLIGQLISDDQGGGVRTELAVDDLIIDPDKLAPIALFAVEAISNARKHALALREGALRVSFSLDGDEAELVISDEGSGSEAAPVLAGEGVGRTLMTAFARQLRGRFEIGPNADGGVTVRLAFPNPAAEPRAPGRARPKRNRAAA